MKVQKHVSQVENFRPSQNQTGLNGQLFKHKNYSNRRCRRLSLVLSLVALDPSPQYQVQNEVELGHVGVSTAHNRTAGEDVTHTRTKLSDKKACCTFSTVTEQHLLL